MKKSGVVVIIIIAVFALAGCTTVDYSVNAAGVSEYAAVAVKDFVTLGIVTVHSTETHHASAMGFSKTISGSKVTFTDLLQEAAKLEADDIINVRVDMVANYKKHFFEWFTGWTRTFEYTGTALAIKYTDKADGQSTEPQFGGLPKAPESTGIIKIDSNTGKPLFR